MNKQTKKSFIPDRAKMFMAAFGVWAFLCAWSLSAFLQHIDSLKPTYVIAARAGACGAEFVLLVFVFFHCFDVHIGVRKWSLWLGVVLAGAVVVHAGALRGLDEATIAQDDTDKRIEEALTRVSKGQAEDAARSTEGMIAGRSQKERMAMQARSQANEAEIRKNAQGEIAKSLAGRHEAIKSTTWLPLWYINGGMYSVMFLLSIIFFGVVCYGKLNSEDVDTNYNNIPDHLETPPQAAQDIVVGDDFALDHIPQSGKARRSLLDRLRGKR